MIRVVERNACRVTSGLPQRKTASKAEALEAGHTGNAHASGGLNNAGTFDAAASSSNHNVRRRPVAPAAGS